MRTLALPWCDILPFKIKNDNMFYLYIRIFHFAALSQLKYKLQSACHVFEPWTGFAFVLWRNSKNVILGVNFTNDIISISEVAVVIRFWHPFQYSKYDQVPYTTLVYVVDRFISKTFQLFIQKMNIPNSNTWYAIS